MLGDTNTGSLDYLVTNPGGPFFPDINLKDWMEIDRLSDDTPKTLERVMLLSMADCNGLLAAWQADQVAAGGSALPAANLVDYLEAVGNRAMGKLMRKTPAFKLDSRIREHLEEMNMTTQDYFDESDQRLSRVTGESIGRGGILAVAGGG